MIIRYHANQRRRRPMLPRAGECRVASVREAQDLVGARIRDLSRMLVDLSTYTADPMRLAWYLRCAAQWLRIFELELDTSAISCRCFACWQVRKNCRVTINRDGDPR